MCRYDEGKPTPPARNGAHYGDQVVRLVAVGVDERDPALRGHAAVSVGVYDYLATGVPVIAICPRDAALLQLPGARRFHHVHHRDVHALVALLKLASQDRTILRPGRLGEGPTRELGIEALHRALLSAIEHV